MKKRCHSKVIVWFGCEPLFFEHAFVQFHFETNETGLSESHAINE